ncbi:MAG TPA: hypothetical protein PK493_06870, partial [Pseudomonadota bacterium]|nr:hypothetical protein [Pseudomonadota bacterium]
MSNGRHFTPPTPAFRPVDPFAPIVPRSAERVPSCEVTRPLPSKPRPVRVDTSSRDQAHSGQKPLPPERPNAELPAGVAAASQSAKADKKSSATTPSKAEPAAAVKPAEAAKAAPVKVSAAKEEAAAPSSKSPAKAEKVAAK